MNKKTSKPQPALLEIRQRKEALDAGQVMTGANTEVFLDGKQLSYVSKVTFEVAARGIAKTVIVMYTRTQVLGKMESEQIIWETVDEKTN